MTSDGYRGWRLLAGVFAVGMLAYGLSLQGAPRPDEGAVGTKAGELKVTTDGANVGGLLYSSTTKAKPTLRSLRFGAERAGRISAPCNAVIRTFSPMLK